ncbi:MAG TPA: argininosuccinate lyase, partial [Kiritimatiellia bacterium]|nr:argininosuccinate lyase [Kiritimatiellia bacterium]
AGFTPDVFATDRALELVAGGMPFRDAYQHVRSHLETLQEADPDRALAAKTHLGATAGLDFGGYRARVRDVRRWVRVRRTRLRAIFSALLGGAADALG